jgi:hypothetical protein
MLQMQCSFTASALLSQSSSEYNRHIFKTLKSQRSIGV